MGGLTEILSSIENEAARQNDVIISDAKHKADEILAKAREEADSIMQSYKEKTENDVKFMLGRISTTNAISLANELLSEKQKLIEEIIVKAKEKILKLDKDDYLKLLQNILDANAKQNEKGEIIFSKRDKELSKKLDLSKCNLTVSDKDTDIEAGFIIRYGDTDLNCSIEALINSNREKYIDKLNRMFS